MSEKVLITPAELSDMIKSEFVVVIDTRDPATYAAGHLPDAVNIHDIFTYLATSTPEGVAAMREKFASTFGAAGLSGTETAVVYEQSMNTGLGLACLADTSCCTISATPRSRSCTVVMLPGPRRECRPRRRSRRPGQELPARSGRRGNPGRPAEHEGGRRRPEHRQARYSRRRRVDFRFLLALWQGLLPAQGTHPRCSVAGMVSNDEAHAERTDVQIREGSLPNARPSALRRRRRWCSTASRARAPRTRWSP